MKKLPLVVALLLPAVLVAVPSSASADDSVTVTWPSTTRFNSTTTSYTFHVHDNLDDDSTLVATSAGEGPVTLPRDGDVTWTFPDEYAEQDYVTVSRCDDTGQHCTVVAVSPALTVIDHLLVADVPATQFVGPHDESVRIQPLRGDEDQTVTAAWSLLDAAGDQVAQGTGTIEPAGSELGTLAIDLPPGMVQDELYTLDVDASADTPDFGHLEGTGVVRLHYDADAQADVSVPDRLPLIAPFHDGYADSVQLVARFDRSGLADDQISVVSPQGRVVAASRLGSSRPSRVSSLTWDGTDRSTGAVVPAGRYLVHYTGVDEAGNRADVVRPLTVSAGRLEWRTWTHHVSARASEVARRVGRCSSLKWLAHGGLGLYSRTRCSTPKQSEVLVEHKTALPRILGASRRFHVSVVGGGHQDPQAYVNLFYLRGNDPVDGVSLTGRPGVHQGPSGGRDLIHGDLTRRPVIYWELALTDGSRYDVHGFTIDFEYQALVTPGTPG